MARLIDADEFYKAQKERCGDGVPFVGTCSADNAMLYLELKNAPTVDAELVVYCKNCMSHRELTEEESRILKNNYCYCNRINKYMPECGFCSMGEH